MISSTSIPVRAPRSRSRGHGRAVVALPNQQHSLIVRRLLKRMGWQVFDATTAAEARMLLGDVYGEIAVLATELVDETGWLACAKVKCLAGNADVVLVGPETPHNRRFARFVGAVALLADPVGLAEWVPPIAA